MSDFEEASLGLPLLNYGKVFFNSSYEWPSLSAIVGQQLYI